MNRYYLIDFKATKAYLSQKTEEDPERTWGSLDLLVENADKNLLSVLYDDKLMIELDDEKKKATLLGNKLPADTWEVIFSKKVNSESIYNSIARAVDAVQKIEGGNLLIKKIIPAK